MIRALFIAAVFFTATPLLISLQWLLGKLGLPGWAFIARNYYRLLCRLLRIRVHVAGDPVRDRPVLFVGNHVSWADIVAIGSLQAVAFVAKRDVRKWPLVGITAEIQRTVFVDRERRHRTADAVHAIGARLDGGVSVVLFAEGTSSDGNRVLPFRSALLGAVETAAKRTSEPILIQPMAVIYTAQQGIPMGRRERPLAAWYGEMDFMPHIKTFIRTAAVDVTIGYGAPILADGRSDRKKLTSQLEQATRTMLIAALRGRPPGGVFHVKPNDRPDAAAAG
jgi:1-acyl-sn-glycerol-3-phosphate acyltransferase